MAKIVKNLPQLAAFFESLSSARVISKPDGEILVINSLAAKLLGKKGSEKWRNLKNLIEVVSLYKNEVIKDYPTDNRIVRYHGQYLDLKKGGTFIYVMLSDVTDDWIGERQKDVLEFIASTASQSLPTEKWIESVLKRIVIMTGITSCNIMLFNREARSLEVAFSSHKITGKPTKLRLNEGLAGISAKQRASLAFYSGINSKKRLRKSTEPGSFLAVPMVVGPRLIGVFNIKEKAGSFFREQDKAFYELVANRLALSFEFKRLVERLKEDYERLTTVITHTLHGKALLNSRKEIIIANPSFTELLERNIEDVVGKRLDELLPELSSLLAKNQKQTEAELELNSLEAKPWVGVVLAKIRRQEGENTVVTIRDITAEKQLEETKNDFIATATHELRTPLTAIRGYLSMINSRPVNLDDKQKVYLQRIDKASNTLSELVEDLLSVLRIDQQATKLKPEKLKLRPIVKEAVHGLETKITNKKIKVSIPSQNYSVHCDANALQKVVLNLIDNAVKYTPRGGKISVKFAPIRSGAKKLVKVSVKDNGLGIPKRQQQRLFEKFERVQNELSVEAGGTGLGLYITKNLVEQWGGTIKVVSSLGKGSMFTFTIPSS